MVGFVARGAAGRLRAVAITMVLLVAACGDGGDEPAEQESLDLPYDHSLFQRQDNPVWCNILPEFVPETGFIKEDIEYETSGIETACTVSQDSINGYRNIYADVYGQWESNDDTATDRFEQIISDANVIEVEGIGEQAVLIPPGTEGVLSKIWPYGVSLLVREGNLVLNFSASSRINLSGPSFRLEELPLAAATAIGTAENYLAELGAENHTLQVPPGDLAEGTTVLPDLCSELAVEGLSLAGDQADWADGSETMDRCHWQGGGADLWLSAEAVGPLDAAGLSGEAFASWWMSSLPAAGGEELAAGDSGYVRLIDPEADNRDDVEDGSVVDFAVRIGNIVLQGRYQDGTLDQVSTASVFAEQISAQTTALVAGA